MKSTLLSFFCLLILHTISQAQAIVGAEYFWDTDPGVGNGTEIVVANGVIVTSNELISITGLSEGLHYFHVRIVDENAVWSHYNTILVSVQDNSFIEITAAEYFWDNDPGVGSGTAINVTAGVSISSQLTLSANVLPGIHFLNIRVRDASMVWSHYNRLMVIVEDNSFKEIISMEYFWDIDPGVGNATEVDLADAQLFDGNVDVSTVGLSLGEHNLYIRVLDETQSWSHYKLITFTLCETFGAISQFETVLDGVEFTSSYTGDFATDYIWQLDGVDIGTDPSVVVSPETEQELCLIASNACGVDTSCAIIGVAQIISVDPASVPNNLQQTIDITGFGFDANASVRIQRNAESIVADAVTFSSSASLIATFTFNMETVGLWDVVVVQEDGTELLLTNGLELTLWIGLSEMGEGNFVGEPYPNPTNGEVFIPFTFSQSTMFQSNVYDIMGSLISSNNITFSGKGTRSLDLQALAAGTYFIELKNEDESKTFRIIKH